MRQMLESPDTILNHLSVVFIISGAPSYIVTSLSLILASHLLDSRVPTHTPNKTQEERCTQSKEEVGTNQGPRDTNLFDHVHLGSYSK